MSLPAPAPTDRAADAAWHIRVLAEAVDARLTGPVAVVKWTISQTADGNGNIYSAALPALASITGAVFGPVAENAGGSYDYNYVPMLTRFAAGQANQVALTCFNAPDSTRNVNRQQAAVGLAWGPSAAAAAAAAPAEPVALGAPFPRGVTPNAKLRYPGTGEPQWGTAQCLQDLAGDVGKAIGGAAALNLVTFKSAGPVTLNASGYAALAVGGVSTIRGAVLTPWDTGTFVRKSRLIGWIPPDRTGDGGATAGNVLRFRVYTNAKYTSGVTYPKPAYGDQLGVMGVLWGDP
jgi:hypothetical protein